jgi:uncharacterized protein (DUF362 family)
MTTVAITHHDNIEQSIADALGHLELDQIIQGKVVAVKPNETWARADDLTAVTQADSLRAVLRHLKEFSPKELIVTGGAGAAETGDVLRLTGMMDVIEEEGAEFFDHNRPPFEEVELTYEPDKDFDGPQHSVMVNPRVLEYDTVVSLAQLKVHATATVTLTMKNIAMSYPAADYYGHPRSKQEHRHQFFDDMHSFIVAMCQRFPIHLGIIVGHPAMVGIGPIGGHTAETGLTIASTDAIAADTVGAKLLGFSDQAVRHLWEAGKIGLGETNIKNMTFPALDIEKAFNIFTEKVYGRVLTTHHA